VIETTLDKRIFMKTTVKINKALARKVLSIVDQGLCNGMGKPIPGQMCVEAAVCFAMGLPHSDEPPCVSAAVRKLKICLNDASWSSNEARTKGMRRLAIAQLGTADTIDDNEFAKQVAKISIQKIVPRALLSAAKYHPDKKHQDALKKAAKDCQKNPTQKTANAAYAAANAAAYAAAYAANAANAAKDAELAFFAEEVVQVLIDMKAQGAQWLDLTEVA
jgi:hypothetical protein